MICIVSGPSCAGKSTLLQHARIELISGMPASPARPVVFPSALQQGFAPLEPDCFFHYNILRLADSIRRGAEREALSPLHFASDEPWQRLLESALPKRAIVLVTTRAVLRERMAAKTLIEPPALAGNAGSVGYSGGYWRDLLDGIDLCAFYRAWCHELERRAIPYCLVDSSDLDYRPLSAHRLHSLPLNG
ncbi:MAG: hypothetical protein K9M02_01635 [Thiohalocapsa sp.]|nr:hypothetical protein [Thiohalocapsa sp.]